MMTPQQFGSLVGDQMGKDAGAVAPKSMPVEALKMVGKAVYHTPRSLKTLAAGGAGGYALGHNAGEASGMEQGKAEAAKNLAERLLGQPAAGVKTAGPISETLGFSSPANILGGAAALMTPTRSLEQQAKFDATDNAGRAIANAVVPGYGAYNMYKRMGSSVRSPEMKAMQAKAMQPQQAPVAAPAPAPTPAPASPLPAGTGHGGMMGGGGPMSMSLAGKQAGAINELLSEFGGRAAQGLKTHARPMLNKAVEGVKTYGKRMMGDSTLKPLYQRADLVNDMTDSFKLPAMGSGARGVGYENYHNLLTSGLDARKAIAKERNAIDLTRNLTTGAGVAGTLGAIGLMARHNNAQPKQANDQAASLATSLAPYTAWGRGYNFGTDTTNQHHQNALAGGALVGGVAGLATEAMREKTEEEKKQSILRKFLRYAATSGAGAVGGAGAGGLMGALTAPGKLRMHDSLAAKLPADFTSGKLEAKGLMGLGPVGEAK